jgi:hypothetical protein
LFSHISGLSGVASLDAFILHPASVVGWVILSIAEPVLARQRSLDLFNKHAGMKLDAKVASLDALDAVKAKPGRICPLICEHGFKADGDLCTRITCRAGYDVGDDNACEKIEGKKPAAKREEPTKRDRPRAEPAASQPLTAQPQASGQIICSQSGCRPLARGCKV